MNVSASPAARAASALVVVSTIFDPWGWAPFGPLKWLAVSVAGLVFVLVALRRPFSVHRWSLVGWGLFLGIGLVAAATGLDPLYAWIGTPERHLGWLSWLLFALAFVAGQSLNTAGDRALIGRAAVTALAIIGAVAIFEVMGLAPADLAGSTGRLGGPFGSAAYLGAACCLLLPPAAGVAVAESGFWRVAALGAMAGGLLALFGSGTRAAFVGLLVAAVVGWRTVVVGRRWVGWRSLGAVGLMAVVLFVTPMGSRLSASLDVSDPGTRGRIDEWVVASRALTDRPILGAGPEGYRVVFPAHVDADYERRYGRTVMPDRAHNAFLDIGVTMGLPSMALALVAFVWLVVVSLRSLQARDPHLGGLGLGVIAYSAQQFFLFPIAEIDPVFWLMCGLVVAQSSGAVIRVGGRWMSVLAGVLASVALAAGVLDVAADRRLASSQRAIGGSALELVEQSTQLRPDSIRYWFMDSRIAAQDDPVRSLASIQRALEISPGDPTLRAVEVERMLDLVRQTNDPEVAEEMMRASTKLIADDPFNAANRLLHGVVLATAGDLSGAEAAWLRAADLAPRSAVPWQNLALLYDDLGSPDDAAAARAEVEERS